MLKLLKVQEAYINFLGENINKNGAYLLLHEISPTESELLKGEALRREMKEYDKSLVELLKDVK